MHRRRLCAGLVAAVLVILSPALPAADATAPRAITIPDALAWKSIRATALSPDGQWFAYQNAPNEGDAELVLRHARSEKQTRFPIGTLPQFRFRPGQPPPSLSAALAFSHDSRWLAFSVYPADKEAKALRKQRKPLQNKVALVNVETGEKTEFAKIARFAFAGENPAWLALHRYPGENQARDKWTGADVLLVELATRLEANIGNVSEFAFDKKGQWLAFLIDAQEKTGNGVQLRNLATGAVQALDSEKAVYKKLRWTEKGDALAVLRGVEDKKYESERYSLLAFSNLSSTPLRKTLYDPAADSSFPAEMTISSNQNPEWMADLSAVTFGLHALKKKESKLGEKPEEKKDEPAPSEAPGRDPAAREPDEDKADLVLWHWQDKRLQSQQQVEESRDKNLSYLAIYRVDERKFIRLADDKLKRVSVAPEHQFAVGTDTSEYELSGAMDGRRYQDIYTVDLKTGQRKLAAKKVRWYFGPSAEGNRFLYYEDGHFYAHDMTTGRARNITEGARASFINTEDDHNVVKPPVSPVGWVKGGGSVLLYDLWDIWNVPVDQGAAVNLTVNGKKDAIRYRRRFRLDPDEKGIDISGAVYIEALAQKTKKAGIARIDGGQAGARMLLWDDALFTQVIKAKNAGVYVYTRETHDQPADYHVADAALASGARITDNAAEQKQFLWSSGARLIEYTSDKGDKLQAALYLPANYELGKSYPMIVYIYEKLTQNLNSYARPAATGFNKSVYTSNGYAVLSPDIVYRVNDPGMSAAWCVVPAVKAAIATGIVDQDRVGIHGHSWGGYQTAFLITQTDIFRAAIAGAALTNMISMYSSIYWNSGSTNQPIFESSQGRFSADPTEIPEAYTRNSPVYHVRNIRTPLLLLHNDKDGAVDFNQGITYYNSIRRLQKPVVLLQYKGENHGLEKPANQKDYAARMREFFDHHLLAKPAPPWLTEGVEHLKVDEELKSRRPTPGQVSTSPAAGATSPPAGQP